MLARSLITLALAAMTFTAGCAQHAGKGKSTMATVQASTRPDVQQIHLSGFGMTRDSVCIALRAAAKALGKDADYARLYLLSGNAFAPAINTGESCRSWWHCQARLGTRNLPAMAASLGLMAERLPLPALSENATDDQRSAYRTSAADAVLRAMDSGAVVITEGGWDEVGAWVWSGVVTDVAPDHTIRGAALSAATGNGKEQVPLKYPTTFWAIRPSAGGAPTTPAAVDRLILTTAIARIRGTGDYATQGTNHYGLAAMDQWITSMQTIRGFCPDCFKNVPVPGVHDAPDNDKRLYEAAKLVARQLRTNMLTLPGATTVHLEQAAACYDRIAQFLEPGATGRNGFTWDSLTSLEAQRDYAKDVLTPVKTELDWAALHLERALAITDGAKLNARLFPAYDQITREIPDQNPVRTNHLLRVIAARALGHDNVDYDDLIMLDGMGTTFAYHPRKYFLMYESVENPERTGQYLVEGTGFGWQVAAPSTPEEAWTLVRRCVDAQTPLVAYWLDDHFIAGYTDAPKPEDRRIYTMGRWSLGQWITWNDFAQQCQHFRRFAHPAGQPVAKSDMARSILQRIVQYAQSDPRANVPFMKEGTFGFDGMERYAADIDDTAKGPDYFDGAWLACHGINRQWHARESAARWLAKAARQYPAAAEPLNRAASLYRQSHDLWLQFRALLSPGPGEKIEDKWRQSGPRQQGADLVRQAIALEKQAAAEVQTALQRLPSQ